MNYEVLQGRELLTLLFTEGEYYLRIDGIHGIAIGDIDFDDDLDIVAAVWPSNTGAANKVWRNSDGTSAFGESLQELGLSRTAAVSLGDLDGDNDLDIFEANIDAHYVWLNDGHGDFEDSGQRLGADAFNAGFDVRLHDLDGDDDLDAVVATVFSGQNIWINDGTGTFSPGNGELKSIGTGLALDDFDGDSDVDIFWPYATCENRPNYNSANKVWFNNGDGTFQASDQRLGEAYSIAVATGDLDGDGDIDAFVANSDAGCGFDQVESPDQANKVWLNDGNGNFVDSGQSLGNLRSIDVALGDLDGDGDLDAFVGNDWRNADRVWLNDGQGRFSDSGIGFKGSVSTVDVALADLQSDGDLDLFVASREYVKIWINQTVSTPIVSPGDANRDFEFNQEDIVQVLQSGKFLSGKSATWQEGDWDGDGVFDPFDIILALNTWNYLAGPYA